MNKPVKEMNRESQSLPIPPVELRRLVGIEESSFYDNPAGKAMFPDLPSELYDSVLDFGSGCGRIARCLIQQQPRPRRYVGIDLHLGMIDWCRNNLTPHAPMFEFHHHDIYNPGFNPEGSQKVQAFPVDDSSMSLVIAWSVFTHVNQTAAEFYLREIARVLRPDGVAVSTWFLFDKAGFPMMQDFQNALFINDSDFSNAVIFDKSWLRGSADDSGLVLASIAPPSLRGFQWTIHLKKATPGPDPVPFPEDLAPFGVNRPPLTPENAESLGRGAQSAAPVEKGPQAVAQAATAATQGEGVEKDRILQDPGDLEIVRGPKIALNHARDLQRHFRAEPLGGKLLPLKKIVYWFCASAFDRQAKAMEALIDCVEEIVKMRSGATDTKRRSPPF